MQLGRKTVFIPSAFWQQVKYMKAMATATMKDIKNAMTNINQVHFVSYAGHDADTTKPTEQLVTIWSSCYYISVLRLAGVSCNGPEWK